MTVFFFKTTTNIGHIGIKILKCFQFLFYFIVTEAALPILIFRIGALFYFEILII
jgi:hypothetical protein